MTGATAIIWVVIQAVLPVFGQAAWQRDGWVFVAVMVAAAIGIAIESLQSFKLARLLVPYWTASTKQWASFYVAMFALGALVAFL